MVVQIESCDDLPLGNCKFLEEFFVFPSRKPTSIQSVAWDLMFDLLVRSVRSESKKTPLFSRQSDKGGKSK